METIVVTGSPNCGKSKAIYELAQWMKRNGWQDDSDGLDGICKVTDLSFDEAMKKGDGSQDIKQLFVKADVRCLLWAPMDIGDCLKSLKELFEKIKRSSQKVNYLITTLRRFDDPQYQLTLREMGWRESGNDLLDSEGQVIIQIPVLKVKHELYNHGRIVCWYNSRTAKLLQTIFTQVIG